MPSGRPRRMTGSVALSVAFASVGGAIPGLLGVFAGHLLGGTIGQFISHLLEHFGAAVHQVGWDGFVAPLSGAKAQKGSRPLFY